MKDTSEDNQHGISDLPEEATRRGDDSEQQVITAMERYKNPKSKIFFNRKERILVQEELVTELALGFEHRRKAIGMALETRLHSIREACNHVLVTGKTHLRQQRLEYFAEVLRKVELRMNTLADEFLQDADQRFENLQNYKSEEIRSREKERLEKSVNDFLSTLDLLMEEFTNIINEHVDHSTV